MKADPAQIEQVLVNLVTNSGDAMPNGGKLVIETANVEIEASTAGKGAGVSPGAYVMLAVSDTGSGMDADTRMRAFEPFFTTKPPGKGSGLGLATVYGAVRQSGGYVTIYSQPGCGTIVEVYLPQASEGPAVRAVSHKGSETILLVDDEVGVRRVVSAILSANGYDVLEADSVAAALSVYQKNAHKIDLVLADVVMPQMNGIELGRQLSDPGGAGEDPVHVRLSRRSGRNRAGGNAPGFPAEAFHARPAAGEITRRPGRVTCRVVACGQPMTRKSFLSAALGAPAVLRSAARPTKPLVSATSASAPAAANSSSMSHQPPEVGLSRCATSTSPISKRA